LCASLLEAHQPPTAAPTKRGTSADLAAARRVCCARVSLKISGSYAVPTAPERAYQLLQDPAVLAKCMPGTDHLEKIGYGEYEMKLKLVIASMGGLFAGKVRITDPHPPESFKLIVEGNGKIGFIKGEGLLNLVPQGESTEVKYDGEVQVGGTIAGVGQRLIDATAKLILKKFFEKFAEEAATK
jgi:carbon monoxide dehydrogenase subunit G